jgi:GH25 family lysozyme M1 (1,4-beta-N-acetylmuramidase)
MKMLAVAIFALCAVIPGALAVYGVDVSAPIPLKAFQCLKSSGAQFAVVRCYQSNGVSDPNCPNTVANAHAAGIPYVDVYHFPNMHQSPASQIASSVSYLKSHNVQFGMYWLDIEILAWPADHAANINFIRALVNAAKSAGLHVGIYTNANNWSQITGNYDGDFGSIPLWYAHYDNSPSFSDFRPFGQWTKPAIKQYQGDATVCGVDVDNNYYP